MKRLILSFLVLFVSLALSAPGFADEPVPPAVQQAGAGEPVPPPSLASNEDLNLVIKRLDKRIQKIDRNLSTRIKNLDASMAKNYGDMDTQLKQFSNQENYFIEAVEGIFNNFNLLSNQAKVNAWILGIITVSGFAASLGFLGYLLWWLKKRFAGIESVIQQIQSRLP